METGQRAATAETGTRARTRRAILDAAIAVLARDSSASLGDIAAAARVGRTTVHRYFPERSDLITAIGAHTLEMVAAATDRARLDDGAALDALDRLSQELFELGDAFTLTLTEPQLISSPEWEEETESDRALLRLIERGQAEGAIDPGLSPVWVQQVLWSLLYAAWSHVRDNGAPKHEALTLCLRTFRKAVASDA